MNHGGQETYFNLTWVIVRLVSVAVVEKLTVNLKGSRSGKDYILNCYTIRFLVVKYKALCIKNANGRRKYLFHFIQENVNSDIS